LKRLLIPALFLAVLLQSCGSDKPALKPSPSRLDIESALNQLSFEDIESAYLQEIGARACVQLMGNNYNKEQLAVALKYFKVLEEIVGSPWEGITQEIKREGTSGRIYKAMCY